MLAVDKYVQIIIFTAKLFNLFILRLENSITFYKKYKPIHPAGCLDAGRDK